MPPVFECRIVAPDHTVFEGRARSLIAPGVEGYFGVLYGHAPMVVQLGTGELKIVDEDDHTRYFAISGGFLEVAAFGEVSVAADAAEAARDIDVQRARAAEERAKERMKSPSEHIDHARAEAALRRALNRLRVADKMR